METIFSSLSFILKTPTLSKTPSLHLNNNTQRPKTLSFVNPTKNPPNSRLVLSFATGGKRVRQDKLKSDKFILIGEVADTLPNGIFRILLENGEYLVANISGKIRHNSVKVQLGDRVKVEVSRYDTSKGRITYRLPNKAYLARQQRLQQQQEQAEQQKLLEKEQKREKKQQKQLQKQQEPQQQGEEDDEGDVEDDEEEFEDEEEDFEEEFEEEDVLD